MQFLFTVVALVWACFVKTPYAANVCESGWVSTGLSKVSAAPASSAVVFSCSSMAGKFVIITETWTVASTTATFTTSKGQKSTVTAPAETSTKTITTTLKTKGAAATTTVTVSEYTTITVDTSTTSTLTVTTDSIQTIGSYSYNPTIDQYPVAKRSVAPPAIRGRQVDSSGNANIASIAGIGTSSVKKFCSCLASGSIETISAEKPVTATFSTTITVPNIKTISPTSKVTTTQTVTKTKGVVGSSTETDTITTTSSTATTNTYSFTTTVQVPTTTYITIGPIVDPYNLAASGTSCRYTALATTGEILTTDPTAVLNAAITLCEAATDTPIPRCFSIFFYEITPGRWTYSFSQRAYDPAKLNCDSTVPATGNYYAYNRVYPYPQIPVPPFNPDYGK